MSPDLRIDWTEVCKSAADYEKIVKMLLVRLHPNGDVIDGRGGDGGREFQVRTSDRLVLYEAKSFTGRLSAKGPSRRSQVETSLSSAARHQPSAWNLIVPIDPNPSELAWFDGLRSRDYPFIDQWLGQTWLEQALAAHPDLVRYATQDKLLEYVRQYKMETEALAGGVPDLLRRFDGLARLSDELSPDWRLGLSQDAAGNRIVEFIPKHDHSPDTAPITFQFAIAIPNEPDTADLRARLRSAQDFGTGVEIPGAFLSDFVITGPKELGLPNSETELERLVLGELPETENLPEQILTVREPGTAIPVANLRFQPVSRTHGPSGGTRLVARDPHGIARLITEVRPDRSLTFRLSATPTSLALPSDVLPALRLLRALHAPNLLVLTLRSPGGVARHEATIPNDLATDPPPDGLVEYVEDLAYIQEQLRQPFPLPATWTRGDAKRAERLRRLIAGETVPWQRGSLTVTIDPAKIAGFKAQFPTERSQLRLSSNDEEVRFGDEIVHTGPIYLTGVVTIDLDAIPDQAEPDEEVVGTFNLIPDAWFEARLGTPVDGPSTAGPDQN